MLLLLHVEEAQPVYVETAHRTAPASPPAGGADLGLLLLLLLLMLQPSLCHQQKLAVVARMQLASAVIHLLLEMILWQ